MVEFQKCRVRIDNAVQCIRETEFFMVERKHMYEQNGFVLAQGKQHEQVREPYRAGAKTCDT